MPTSVVKFLPVWLGSPANMAPFEVACFSFLLHWCENRPRYPLGCLIPPIAGIIRVTRNPGLIGLAAALEKPLGSKMASEKAERSLVNWKEVLQPPNDIQERKPTDRKKLPKQTEVCPG